MTRPRRPALPRAARGLSPSGPATVRLALQLFDAKVERIAQPVRRQIVGRTVFDLFDVDPFAPPAPPEHPETDQVVRGERGEPDW